MEIFQVIIRINPELVKKIVFSFVYMKYQT